MPTLVGVSLRTAGKVYYYETGDQALATGDWVVIETIRGLELGEVVPVPDGTPPEAAGRPARQVIRKAEEPDFDQHFRNRLRAAEALALSRERVQRHDLPMKMLDAELTLDGSKVVLYFGAEARVDFRGLVRDLAAGLRKRIELHQVGARDRSALTGGLGPCGRECCCSSWIREFSPVSIKMAKEQGLSLNPSKISGSCGRLMCCLRYEYHTYRELRKEMPRLGDELRIPEGRVRVVAMNLARHTLTVEHPEKGTFEIPAGRAQELEEATLCTSCSTPKAPCGTAPAEEPVDLAPAGADGRRVETGRAPLPSTEGQVRPERGPGERRARQSAEGQVRSERGPRERRVRESAEGTTQGEAGGSRPRESTEGRVRPPRERRARESAEGTAQGEAGESRPRESTERRVRPEPPPRERRVRESSEGQVRPEREPRERRARESSEGQVRPEREPRERRARQASEGAPTHGGAGESHPRESTERRPRPEGESGERRPRHEAEAGKQAPERRRPRGPGERRAGGEATRRERPAGDEAPRPLDGEAPRPERRRRRPDGKRPHRGGAPRPEGSPERPAQEPGTSAAEAKRSGRPHRRGRKKGRGPGPA